NALSEVKDLEVRPQRAVMDLTDQDQSRTADTIKKLRVEAVVQCQILKQRDVLVLTWQLFDGQDRMLGGRSETKRISDLLVLSQGLARSVAARLLIKLSVTDQSRLAKRPTDNLEALKHYIAGRLEWNKYTKAGFDKSISHFRQAIREDENYAL